MLGDCALLWVGVGVLKDHFIPVDASESQQQHGTRVTMLIICLWLSWTLLLFACSYSISCTHMQVAVQQLTDPDPALGSGPGRAGSRGRTKSNDSSNSRL